jgi:hypothetical protein
MLLIVQNLNYLNYMMNTSALKKTTPNKKITLLKKADFVSLKPELKHLKVSELRDHFKMTHIVDGKFRDMRGYCFSCLTPLKADYTRFENYCLDC